MADSQAFESFPTLRADLIQLTRFVRALEEHAGRETCLAVRPDYDLWLVELEYGLQIYCERCGRQLDYDLIGIEAYATAAYARLCQPCYDTVTRDRNVAWIGYAGARLAAHGAVRPDLLAGMLARAMERRKLTNWALEHELNLDESGLLRLALSPCPRPDHADEDIARLATAIGCQETALRRILEEDREAKEAGASAAMPSASMPADEPLPF